MNKRIPITLLLLGVLLNGIIIESVDAKSNDSPQPMEEIFPEVGYKTVEAALKEFEQHFKKELKLPLRVPPIAFTHQFGRFSDLDGEMNDSFELKLIHDQNPRNHYKINVRPIKHKIPFEKYFSKTYKLNNGIDAGFINTERIPFHLLVFERDSWQYVLSIDKSVSDQVTPEVLVQIANSIDY